MNRKIVGFLIIAVGLIFMVAIVYFVFSNGLLPSWLNFWDSDKVETPAITIPAEIDEKKENSVQTPSNNNKKIIIPKNNINNEDRIENDEVEITNDVDDTGFGKDDLIRMASSFAERFGSYSNQSNFSNVIDLKIFMTEKMKKWADSYVLKNRQIASDSEIYFGITTKSIDTELKEYDDDLGIAEVVVITRRREARSTRTNVSNVFTQDITIKFKRESNSWKIDSAFWIEN